TQEDLERGLARIQDFLGRRRRRLLMAIAGSEQRASLSELCGGSDVELHVEGPDADLPAVLNEHPADVLVLDTALPAMKGLELIQRIRTDNRFSEVPILVYSGGPLTRKDEAQLKRLVQSGPVKDIRSPERLLDETALFLHRRFADLPEPRRRMLETLHQASDILAGKQVLVVDDDTRSISAMTSIREPHAMRVLSPEAGQAAITMLQEKPGVDVLLMDIMMPDMDGYDTMRATRRMPRFRSLPII